MALNFIFIITLNHLSSIGAVQQIHFGAAAAQTATVHHIGSLGALAEHSAQAQSIAVARKALGVKEQARAILAAGLATGIILVGCCPGGVSSNIMSFLCKGDVAFSVGMTCASTLLAPFMTPLLMKLTAGQIIHIDAVGMFLNILIVTILPVSIGCALNYFFSRRPSFPTLQSLMPGVSVICLAMIVGGVISTVHDDLVARGLTLFLWTFAVVLCHNSLGYLLGWTAGRLAGFTTAKKRTISIEVGMQNAGLATVLASNFFAAQPLAVLPCAISCAWHSISGTILAGLFLKWEQITNKMAKK